MKMKNIEKGMFRRTEMHKLEENRDKKEHSPHTPTFFGVGLVTVVCFMLLFVGSIGEASATDWSAPVPDDHIQPLRFKVTDWQTLAEVIQNFESRHRRSEQDYNGDGSWGCGYCGKYGGDGHPLYRDTARNVLGYIDAYRVTGKGIYRQRAKEGLDYLVREQMDNGQWRWWYGPGGSRGGTLYVSSIPTVALIEGYKLFNDQRYLDAAEKGAKHISSRGNHANANYDFFAAWALSAYYELTGDPSYLDRAISFALYAITDAGGSGYQLPSGGWSDRHNQMIWYHGIITRGLVKLLSVMPTYHSNYNDIEKATYKAMNHLRLRQTEDGKWLKKPSDSADHSWNGQCAMAISMAITELNWPVRDSLYLASKTSGSLIGTGSMLRAYPSDAGTGTISGPVVVHSFVVITVLVLVILIILRHRKRDHGRR